MVNVNELAQLSFILLMSFFGALCNDYYYIVKGKETKINITRIVLGSIAGALIIFSALDIKGVSKHLEGRLFISVSFISGIGGFKYFEWMQKINLIKIAKRFITKDINDKEEE